MTNSRMPRRLPRLLASAVVTAVLATGAVVATGAPAAQAHRDDHRRAQTPTSTVDERRRLPAPPRPAATRPSQRTVGGSAGTGRSRSTPGREAGPAVTGGASVSALVPSAATGTGAVPGATARTLVLYDNTGAYGWLGEAYAMLAANLASHFGSWAAHPVADYAQGELAGYTAVIYLGSTYDEPVPVAFLDDVLATSIPVVWVYDNIWQLTARQADFATARGFMWRQFDFASVAQVRYHGATLTRDTLNAAGIMDSTVTDPARATVLAEAVRADGTTLPWAVRSGNLTYVGEVPFAYIGSDDRYLAFADLLFDALAPTTQARHRALVRIEDVGPDADPAELRAVADYLASKKVPFTVAVYPRYRDPKGVNNGGVAEDYTLRQRPQVVSALRYMQSKGGTLLMHGYTHQWGNVANPYDGVSGNDFEFYRAHVDANDSVIYDGPVTGDSALWAAGRITASATEFLRAGLASPTMFEFPHYAGSATDYRTVATRFAVRYDRGLYFPGLLTGTGVDHSRIVGQFFPYAVRDVYGSAIVPENLGNVEPEAFNNHPARLPADLLASAQRNLVVRDGVASFFFHPYLDITYLRQMVEGVQGLGYTFVPASATLTS